MFPPLPTVMSLPRGLGLLAVTLVLASGCAEPRFHPADRVDNDGDGFFAIDESLPITLNPQQLEDLRLDCKDDDDDIFPNAAELCDGKDNDCDGEVEADETDEDGDGFSECGFSIDPDKLGSDDCDDTDAEIYPGRTDVCDGKDNDCDGRDLNGALWPGLEQDVDGDGYLPCPDYQGTDSEFLGGDDCSDDPTLDSQALETHPGVAVAVCSDFLSPDGLGTDCAPYSGGQTAWWPDKDRDRDADVDQNQIVRTCGLFPTDYSVAIVEGQAVANYIEVPPTDDDGLPDLPLLHNDCDDTRALFNSRDADGDGYSTCGEDGIADQTDDADLNFGGVTTADEGPGAASIYPGALELCDGYDNDIDGAVDEDFDGDADGTVDGTNVDCQATYALSSLDCNDSDATLNQSDLDNDGVTTCGPDAIANSGDEDCNDGNSLLNRADFDEDTFDSCGNPTAQPPVLADCDDFDENANRHDADGDGHDTCGGFGQPEDCDDADSSVFPGAPILCDGVDDNDCNGVIDPNEVDLDQDGDSTCEGDCNDQDDSLTAEDSDSDSFSSCTGDCDDNNGTAYPGAPIVCDNVSDNDCNGEADSNEVDLDNDGQSPCQNDCDDFNSTLNSLDSDGDGFSTCEGDCDDGSTSLSPGVDADGDGWDTCGGPGLAADCDDGNSGLNWNDADGDGASTCSSPVDCDDQDPTLNQADSDGDGVTSCGSDGQVASGDEDCDDGNSSVGSGDAEIRDGLDNDCDGTADEGFILSNTLVIAEMMIAADPGNNDGVGEYLELYNPFSISVDLRGWTVEVLNGSTSQSEFFTFPQGVDVEPILVPGLSRTVLARANNADAYNADITSTGLPTGATGYIWQPPLFSNVSGSITFRFGVDVDVVSWTGSSSSAWDEGVAMSMPGNLSSASASQNDNASSNWCAETSSLGGGNLGSPGAISGCN